METGNEKIRYRVLIPLVFAMLVLGAVFVFSINWLQQKGMDEEVQSRVHSVQQMLAQELNDNSKLLAYQISSLKNDKYLQKLWIDRDREALLDYTLPILEDIRTKNGVTRFYFHGVDRINFLRVHKPGRYGDYIDRSTMSGAERNGGLFWGIELGHMGTFTLRVISPWRINGKLAGYIELAEDIEHITQSLKNIVGVELFFIIDKSFLDRAGWEKGMKRLGRNGNWQRYPNFVIIDQTMEDVPKGLGEYLKLHELCKDADHLLSMIKMSSDDRYYQGGFVPLIDAAGNEVGDIVVIKDTTSMRSSLAALMLNLVFVFVFVLAALFGLFYVLLGRLEDSLASAYKRLQEEVRAHEEADWKVRRQEVFLRHTIDSLDQPFYVIDANDYRVKISNSAGAGSEDLAKAVKCYELIYNTDKPCRGEHVCPVEQINRTREPVVTEHTHHDKEGNEQIVEVHAYPVFDEKGEVAEIIEYYLDISERKKAEKQLAKTMEDLERFNRLAVGRELRMVELKRQVNELLSELGRETQYKVGIKPETGDAEFL